MMTTDEIEKVVEGVEDQVDVARAADDREVERVLRRTISILHSVMAKRLEVPREDNYRAG